MPAGGPVRGLRCDGGGFSASVLPLSSICVPECVVPIRSSARNRQTVAQARQANKYVGRISTISGARIMYNRVIVLCESSGGPLWGARSLRHLRCSDMLRQ